MKPIQSFDILTMIYSWIGYIYINVTDKSGKIFHVVRNLSTRRAWLIYTIGI